jgi:hypothetical protein
VQFTRVRFALLLIVAAALSIHRVGADEADVSWLQLSPQTAPPPRWSAGELVYDSARDVLVTFGGIVDGGSPFGALYRNDTWEWNGDDWTERTPTVAPGPRRDHAIVYDSVRRRTYVISGLGFNTSPPFNLFRYDDMWAWDGHAWTEIVVSPRPSASQGAKAAFDEQRGEVVYFGGRCVGGSGQDCNDTWTFNGAAWTRHHPATAPTRREQHALVYDSRRGKVVMFGGSSDPFTFLNDTWEWDGSNWSRVETPTAPSTRVNAGAAFDAVTGRVILYGGARRDPSEILSDTWAFDGTSWTQLAIPGPPRRQVMGMGYRPDDRVILFGGLDNTFNDGRINYAETWRLGPSTDTAPPAVLCTAPPIYRLHQNDAAIAAKVQDNTVGSGVPAAIISAPADTSSVGMKSVTLTGTDWAANTTTVACPYVVTYDFSGFDAPALGDGVLNEVVAQSEILFKWRLTDIFGAPVTDLSAATMTVSNLSCALGQTADLPPLHSRLRNLGDGYYKINWATPKSYAGSCKIVRFDFGEGITRDVRFAFVQ